MPTLTLDLPDAAYQAALAFDPAERVRLATVTFIAAEAALRPVRTALLARHEQDTRESAAFDTQLTEAEQQTRRDIVEAGSAAGDAGRVVDAAALFSRIRSRYSANTETAETDMTVEKDDPQPELTEEDYTAIGEGLAQLERGEGTSGEIVFARLRAKYGFPKGNSPL